MNINYPNFVLATVVFFNPLMALINNNNKALYFIVSLMISVLLLFVLIKKSILPLIKRDYTSILFLILILYTYIINSFYMTSFINMIKLPLILLSLMVAYITSKYLTKLKVMTIKKLIIYSIWITIITLLIIYVDKANGVVYYSSESFTTDRSIVGNFSKLAKVLFPIFPILFYGSSYLFMGLSMLGILLTMRRSILIAEFIMIFIVIYGSIIKKNILSKKIKTYILLFIIGLIYVLFNSEVGNNILGRLLDLQDGSGSGRTIFWKIAFDNYLTYNSIESLFGNPTKLIPYMNQYFGHKIGAHQDILDYLNNYGLFGLTIMYSIYISMLISFIKAIKISSKDAYYGIAVIFATLFVGMASGGTMVILNILTFIFIGFLIGNIEQKKGLYNEKR